MRKNIDWPRTYLLFLAFISGTTIMAVEISASRLLAPYFGTSTFVWTNIIGVIMIALAIGYYLGGKLSDYRPEKNLLLKLIIIACVYLLIFPFLIKYFTDLLFKLPLFLNSASAFIFGGSLLTVTILFIFPIMLLGCVSPFIIKLLSSGNSSIGKDAGLVFSISTIGSIAGTFLPVLIFIPYLGTRKTIIIFTLLLLITSLLGLSKRKKYLLLFVLILPLNALPLPTLKNTANAIYENESVYQYSQVEDRDNIRYLRINEGLAIFSALNMTPDKFLTGLYYDYYNLIPYLDGNGKKQDILILGLAGGTISTQLNHYFAQDYQLDIDGVEIDNKIIETAKKYFNLENQSLKIHNFDGRNFLALSDKKYNSVIIDVYSNQLYISFHLTSKEFFKQAKDHLKDGGIVAMNVNASSENSKLLKNITNNMNLIFKNVYWVQKNKDDWNYMVLASDNDLDFPALSKLNMQEDLETIIFYAQKNNVKVPYDSSFGFLTDDKAPIEHLTDWMILDYLY